MAAWQKYFDDIPIRAIYCSELARSRRSAELIRKSKDVSFHIVPKMNEINLGKWDGEEMSMIKIDYPEEWETRGKNLDTFKLPEGESFLDVSRRVIPFFEGLAQTHKNNDILIMGHAGINRVILCHVLSMPLRHLFRLDQDYACLNIIEKREENYRLKKRIVIPNLANAACIDDVPISCSSKMVSLLNDMHTRSFPS